MTFSSYNTYQLTSGELTSEAHTLGLSHHHWTLTWISSSLKLFNKLDLITMQVIFVNYSVKAEVLFSCLNYNASNCCILFRSSCCSTVMFQSTDFPGWAISNNWYSLHYYWRAYSSDRDLHRICFLTFTSVPVSLWTQSLTLEL